MANQRKPCFRLSFPVNRFTGTELLKKSCQLWLEKKTKSFEDKKPVTDVLLLGDEPFRFPDTLKLSENDYRVWTVGSASKRICTDRVGLKDRCVGVIPRYELFPKAKRDIPMPAKSGPWSLIYSGRSFGPKNVDLCMRVTCLLQNQYQEKVRFIGLNWFEDDQCRGYLWNLNHQLNWKIPPLFLNPSSPQAWIKKKFKNPVLVNFSTFEMDDFGVSVAQAQSKGWPCILSDWGGHQDVEGTNVITVPTSLIGDHFEPESVKDLRAQQTARYIALRMNSLRKSPRRRGKSIAEKNTHPKKISGSHLKKFAKNDHPRALLDELRSPAYRRIFRGDNAKQKSVIFLVQNDFFSAQDSFGKLYSELVGFLAKRKGINLIKPELCLKVSDGSLLDLLPAKTAIAALVLSSDHPELEQLLSQIHRWDGAEKTAVFIHVSPSKPKLKWKKPPRSIFLIEAKKRGSSAFGNPFSSVLGI